MNSNAPQFAALAGGHTAVRSALRNLARQPAGPHAWEEFARASRQAGRADWADLTERYAAADRTAQSALVDAHWLTWPMGAVLRLIALQADRRELNDRIAANALASRTALRAVVSAARDAAEVGPS